MSTLHEIIEQTRSEIYYGPRDYAASWWTHSLEDTLCYAYTLAGLTGLASGPVVEIGTDSGLGTIALAWAARNTGCRPVHTFDINARRSGEAQERLQRHDLQAHFHLHSSKSAHTLVDHGIGLAYIDGDHSYEWCRRDLENLAPLLSVDGKILLHDCSSASNPILTEIDLKSNGVFHAVAEFLHERPTWSCVALGNGFVVVSHSQNHPLMGRDWQQTLKEIQRG